jgi:hypothetical protein
MTLDDAKNLTLLGNGFSWDCNGGKPLALVPDDVLRVASRWFRDKLQEQPSRRMEQQIQAIALVLEDREARSPQARFAL